jgi:hypothetical protein
MAHKSNTLESSGYLYNPFTNNDIWGAPPQLNLRDLHNTTLPVGADDSALPQFTDRSLQNSGPVQGSVTSEVHRTVQENTSERHRYILLGGFIAVLALALLYKR